MGNGRPHTPRRRPVCRVCRADRRALEAASIYRRPRATRVSCQPDASTDERSEVRRRVRICLHLRISDADARGTSDVRGARDHAANFVDFLDAGSPQHLHRRPPAHAQRRNLAHILGRLCRALGRSDVSDRYYRRHFCVPAGIRQASQQRCGGHRAVRRLEWCTTAREKRLEPIDS